MAGAGGGGGRFVGKDEVGEALWSLPVIHFYFLWVSFFFAPHQHMPVTTREMHKVSL